MSSKTFQPGDWAIYRVQKVSTRPGPRAKNVNASAHGEDYNYLVDKFWIVKEVLDDGQLLLRTRRGKTHVVAPDDSHLRRPRWWEKLLLKGRFHAVEKGAQGSENTAPPSSPGTQAN